MNSVAKNFQNYVNGYLVKSNWDFNSNGVGSDPYIGLKYINEKVFGYIDYEKSIIHIPEIQEFDFLKKVSYEFKTKKRLLDQWKCNKIIEIHILNDNLFLYYIKLLELACKKINNRI